MTFRNGLALVLCLLAFNNSFAHKTHATKVLHYQQTQISNSLFLFSSKGGNIIVSEGKDGLLLIDNGYSDIANHLQTALGQLDAQSAVKYIINTHWHFDHTGGNRLLGDAATIIAHDTVRSRLASESEIPFFSYQSEGHPAHALPTLTYPDAMKVHFNGDELQLEHFPNSHTDGDTAIFFKKANLVHMGDLMFYPSFPFIDLHNGGHAINYLKSINNRINNETIIIPGHGPMTNKKGLNEFQAMLEQTISEVRVLKNKGMNLRSVQRAGLHKKWQKWGTGFINEAVG